MGVVTGIPFNHVKLLINKVFIINIGMSFTFCHFGMSKIPIPHSWHIPIPERIKISPRMT